MARARCMEIFATFVRASCSWWGGASIHLVSGFVDGVIIRAHHEEARGPHPGPASCAIAPSQLAGFGPPPPPPCPILEWGSAVYHRDLESSQATGAANSKNSRSSKARMTFFSPDMSPNPDGSHLRLKGASPSKRPHHPPICHKLRGPYVRE